MLRNSYCENQAFVLGPHIGFQCHIEMTAPMVKQWCVDIETEVGTDSENPSVQNVEAIMRDQDTRVHALNQLSDRVYRRWTGNLKSA